MMTHEEVLKKVNDVFHDVFDDDSLVIAENTTANDIEDWDSLTHIELISSIEDAFGVKFNMKEVMGLKNVGEMVDILEVRCKN